GDLLVGGRAGADQRHREVTTQQRHRGVLDVEPEGGEVVGRPGDDARPVVAQDGDGVEGAGVSHAGHSPTWRWPSSSWPPRATAQDDVAGPAISCARSKSSSVMAAVRRPVKVLCGDGWKQPSSVTGPVGPAISTSTP